MHAATSTLNARPDASIPMALGRVIGAYLAEARYESIRMLRAPGFSIPFLVLPVPAEAMWNWSMKSREASGPGAETRRHDHPHKHDHSKHYSPAPLAKLRPVHRSTA